MDKKETPYYFSVIDRKTKKIICTGPAVQWKYVNGYKFVSTDGIYFFKESYNDKLVGGGDKFQIVKDLTDQITILESYQTIIIPFLGTVDGKTQISIIELVTQT